MSIIEEIKRDYADFVPHDDECDIYLTLRMKPECNCSRRRKIALLERLEEPTERMRRAGMQAALHAQGSTPDGIWMHVCRDVIAAAEEDLP